MLLKIGGRARLYHCIYAVLDLQCLPGFVLNKKPPAFNILPYFATI